ncbi:hypothetical protein RHSIM_Rhsim13G0196600 [Rhododendron simsii]|uniref:U-box domain-containing protein n=1 Tax=Rhododendron simsii TaxID=118357 RepID=A0A834G094_RHOSS|nr:hypothetical protein RHSIM_Rhsim13G0196600 [Rhododendron simsii]
MKDPVTTVSGITYDRESIEHWLSTAKDTTACCPVTKQPMPRDSDLTPNHTLRRLIQSWCVLNANKGVDRIPTPKSPMNKSHVLKLVRNLNVPDFHAQALKKMEEIAGEGEKSRECMVEAGAVKAMISWLQRRFKEGKFESVKECLKILHLIWKPTEDAKEMVKENGDLIDSLLWVLSLEMEEKENNVSAKTHALLVLRTVLEVTSSALLERLNLNFFNVIVAVMRKNISSQATKAALRVLIQVCPFGRNRLKVVECGAVFELIELELNNPEKSLTELIFCLLAQLCACADGRAQFLKHAGGIAVAAKRILRVSPATDDRAVHVLSSVARYSATNEVLMEMLRVGAVSKLCMVLQANSDKGLKRRAREVLRLHSNVWNNDSPCIAVYLLTKDPR